MFGVRFSVACGGFGLKCLVADGSQVPQARCSAAAFAFTFRDFTQQSCSGFENGALRLEQRHENFALGVPIENRRIRRDVQARVGLAFAGDYGATPTPELFEDRNSESFPQVISCVLVQVIAAKRSKNYDRRGELQRWGEFSKRQRICYGRNQRLRPPRGQAVNVGHIEIAKVFRLGKPATNNCDSRRLRRKRKHKRFTD